MIPDADLAEARTLMGLGRADAVRGRHKRALAAFDEARALLGPEEAGGDEVHALRARNATLRCFSLRPLGRLAEARSEGLRALALAGSDVAARALAEQVYGSAAIADGEMGEGIAAYRRAVDLAREAGAPRIEGLTLLNLALALTNTGAFREARGALDLGRALLVDDPFHIGRAALFEGELARAQGALDAAEPCLEAALRTADADGDVAGALHARVSLVEVALARGDIERARRGLDDVAGITRFVDDVSWGPRLAALWDRVGEADVHGGLRRVSPQRVAAPRPERCAADAPVALRLDAEGRHVEIDGAPLDFGRRGPLRRVLVALARARIAGVTLSADALLDAGWPGERMSPQSGAARVYTTIRRLRDLGLERVLFTLDDGYVLSADCEVEM